MNHVQHIAKNKENIVKRARIIALIRDFFAKKNFLEVETPLIVQKPGQEPNLAPISLTVHDERNKSYNGYLHTSPEYTMKKILAAGFGNTYSICKCFRDRESFGISHNPEFTMIEWYRVNADMFDLIDDVKELTQYIARGTKLKKKLFGNWEVISMKRLWRRQLQIDLDQYLDQPSMLALCRRLGHNAQANESYEQLFYRIFLNDIEPELKGARIIHHYPAPMAALSRLSADNPGYAERFEVYIDGLELANAFSELADPREQEKRLAAELEYRSENSLDTWPIDRDFIAALESGIPNSAGIALGIDRLTQIYCDCQNIDDVLILPMSKIFK